MASSTAPGLLRTPPCRSHHRMDSFPFDAPCDGSELGFDDENAEFGVATSVSLGAFPMFLLQDSPSRSPAGKPVAQFPESPELAYDFLSSSPATDSSPEKYTRVQRLRDDSLGGAGSPERHCSTHPWDSQSSTPTRPPHLETRLNSGDLPTNVQRKLSLAKAGIDFGRRLYPDEDETLVGHYETTNKRLRPVVSFSSTASTSIPSPLSDTFSPGSTSCSVSTASSRPSPRYDEKFNLGPDDFPAEVGGMASLDLEPGAPMLRQLFADMDGTIELSHNVDFSRSAIDSTSQSSFTLSTCHESTREIDVYPSELNPLTVEIPPSSQEESASSTVTSPRSTLKRGSYNHLVRPNHPGPSRQHTPNSSISSTLPSPTANHRRAFSGASERLREFRQELIAQSTTGNGPLSGRFRSSSVSSSAKNAPIEGAARSRSNSASGAGVHGTARTLSSAQSKDSLRSKFANLPGYVTFLREITLEIWIDQEGFRAIRPQLELHRYTPGQRMQPRPTRRSAKLASPTTKAPPSLVAPISPLRSMRPKSVEPLMTPTHPAEGPLACEVAWPSPQTSPVSLMFESAPVQEAAELRPQFLENWGTAEFTMKKRRGWNFHHGVVDGDPMIRRMTINGVEDRDYLSREASLNIRSNGVYTAKGSEDRGKFSWKFEYLVEDRRGHSGAIIQGEKTLTPLTFSCSPELLIPEQGKKVKLLHVMKKSVIPKITASKMDPPLVPTTPGNTSAGEPTHLSGGSVGKTFETLAKMVRSSSHGKSRGSTPKHAYTPSQTPVHNGRRLATSVGACRTIDKSDEADESGRRRAVSYSNMRPDLKTILGDEYEG